MFGLERLCLHTSVFIIIIVIPTVVHIDRGTETDLLATMQSYLFQLNLGDDYDGTDCVMHGPSTQNKIERWWRELHHRMETYFKEQLKRLLESGQYDATDQLHRYILNKYTS